MVLMKNQVSVFGRNGRYIAEVSASVMFIFEKTGKGVLATTIDRTKGVLDQEYVLKSLEETIGAYVPDNIVTRVNELPRTTLEKACGVCGTKLVRELEFADPAALENVPVVPIFRCVKCDKRYYSMTKEYVERLVERNMDLFEPDEISELGKSRESSINNINEYIIRIFASKKISRI